jgi:hypothetical protein
MKISYAVMLLTAGLCGHAAAEDDAAILRAHLQQHYPSLDYVARYRSSFPAEIQGDDALWSAKAPLPKLGSAVELTQALVGLQDQHVSVVGAKAGKTETLGVLFRTSSDGHMIVWRVFEPALTALRTGDVVLEVNGVPTAAWLARAAALTFGGNRRSRAAEASLKLGLGNRAEHDNAALPPTVHLTVRTGTQAGRSVALPYLPMSPERAGAMTVAINSHADLPRTIAAGRYRVATVRLGAFAPQYDPLFNAAAEQAEKAGGTKDQPMLAGFCAVVRAFVADVNNATRDADLLLLDLRGNFGGFGREARLMAAALSASPLPRSFDVFASGKRGTVRLEQQPEDPACGHVDKALPLVVLTDAGTRSSGELMAAWLWSGGAIVAGERTIGAAGGLDSTSKGFALPGTGYAIKASGNFTFFDSTTTLHAGETAESALVDLVAQERFAPSRARPFAIQSVGLRPDLEMASTVDDLHDGGLAQVSRMVAALEARKLLR